MRSESLSQERKLESEQYRKINNIPEPVVAKAPTPRMSGFKRTLALSLGSLLLVGSVALASGASTNPVFGNEGQLAALAHFTSPFFNLGGDTSTQQASGTSPNIFLGALCVFVWSEVTDGCRATTTHHLVDASFAKLRHPRLCKQQRRRSPHKPSSKISRSRSSNTPSRKRCRLRGVSQAVPHRTVG